MKEIIDKEYSQEFMGLFEIVLDITQYSNLEILGHKFLKYQENFILEQFAANLEGSEKVLSKKEKKLLYDFKRLKCNCSV